MDDISIITFFGFLATLCGLLAPLLKLNGNIVKLNANFENMLNMDKIRDERITEHGKEIDLLDNKQRENTQKLKNCEKLIDNHEIRLGRIEERMK